MKNVDKINWYLISRNKNATTFLLANQHMINNESFSLNEDYEAILYLSKYPQLISWSNLSFNQNAIHLLKQNPSNIDYSNLSFNQNPDIISILKSKESYINWYGLSQSPHIFHI